MPVAKKGLQYEEQLKNSNENSREKLANIGVKRKVLTNISNLPQETPAKKVNQENSVKTQKSNFLETNCFLLPQYSAQIFQYLQEFELQNLCREWPFNERLTASTRRSGVNWIWSVSKRLKLLQETIHLSVFLLDKCLESSIMELTDIKIIALCCVSLATKVEEVKEFSFKRYLKACDPRHNFKRMEITILKLVDFKIGRPSSLHFLRRYSLTMRAQRIQHNMGKFIIDLVLFEEAFCHERPSKIASAASFISVCILNRKITVDHWSKAMVAETGYTYKDLHPLILRISSTILRGVKTFNSVMEKYSDQEFHFVVQRITSEKEILETLCS